MKLVKLDNYQIEFEPELLLLKPFKRVWTMDRTKDKNKFMEFLTILYFVYDSRSEFNYITDEDERIKEVCSLNGFDIPKFNKDELDCITIYKKSIITTSSLLLEDTRVAIDNIRQFLRNVDLTATDDKGKPLYTVNNITTAIKQIPQLAKDIMETEKLVAKEIEEAGRARGNQGTKTLMDDGILV
jgi:hypothetical protein